MESNISLLALKGQVMADFITDFIAGKGWWVLHVDRASKALSLGVGLILQPPTGELLEQAIWLGFPTSNNEVEYEAILVVLDLAHSLSTVKLKKCNDFQLVIEQIQKEYEAKDERMAHYLALIQDSLAKLGEWVVERVPQTENLKADTLVGIAATLLVNEIVLLSIYLIY